MSSQNDIEKCIASIEDIRATLPHSYPFLLLDRVVDMKVGVWVKAYKNISFNEWFFKGHFPSYSVMPGVLIIEALAQAGAYCILKDPTYKDSLPFLTGVDDFKFKGNVRPGDRLDLFVEIKRQMKNFGIAKAHAEVSSKMVCQGQISFCLYPKDSLKF